MVEVAPTDLKADYSSLWQMPFGGKGSTFLLAIMGLHTLYCLPQVEINSSTLGYGKVVCMRKTIGGKGKTGELYHSQYCKET